MSQDADIHPVYVTLPCGGTYRLPGPLALIQTGATGAGAAAGQQEITHVNALSLSEIAANFPVASPTSTDTNNEQQCNSTGPTCPMRGTVGGSVPLTSVTRGGVRVQALMVVAVHAALLAGSGSGSNGSSSDGGLGAEAAAAAEQRSLLRAAARLTWGLSGMVFELMHASAGHWPSLGPVERQAVAGAALTQLHRLNRGLALGVLRAYGQLTPERFGEMLESGLLPAPARAAAAAPAAPAGGGGLPPADEACTAVGGSSGGHAPRRRDAEEAAAHV